MSKENVVEDDVVTQETPEQALAAQKGGFAEANSSTTAPVSTEKSAEQIQADEEAEAAKVAAEAAAAQATQTEQAKLTAAELEDLRRKAGQYEAIKANLDKVNGKFGSVEAQLKKLTEAKSSGVALTEEDVADLAKEYGPELSSALLKTLNKFGAKLGASPADAVVDDKAKVDAAVAAVKEEFAAELTKTKQETSLQMLNMKHGDWKTLVRVVDAQGNDLGLNPEFGTWVSTLPAGEQEKVLNSWDAQYLSDKIGEYKMHKETVLKAQQDAAKKKQVVPNRLKTAIVPQSLPGTITTKSALDEQREGYKTA